MARRRSTTQRAALSLFRSTGRDFVCAFVVFLLLFALLAPESSTIKSLSAFSVAASSPGIEFPFAALPTAPFESSGYRFSDFVKAIQLEPASAVHASQFTMILAAALFAAMVAFNLAFFRHLRRVHASSRRGAWRGN